MLVAGYSRCNDVCAQAPAPTSLIDQIYKDDQISRMPPGSKEPARIYKTDEERLAIARKLLEQGKLETGSDYYEAGIIFQHSHQPDDYLIAHTLAVVAASRGETKGSWLAAATLDRYLMAIGKPQIYGTQFMTPPAQPVTQDPYNRTLIPDPLRQMLGVPTLVDQEKRRQQIERDVK